jgi:transposase
LIDQRAGFRFAVGTDSDGQDMGGKSAVEASDVQCVALTALAGSRDRGEADRARAVLLTLAGWTNPRVAEAFGVRDDTVRLWRSDFGRGGVDALKASVAPGPLPVKSSTTLRVVTPLLEEPVADRPNWTIARLRAEIEAREGAGAGNVRARGRRWSAGMSAATGDASHTHTHTPAGRCNRRPRLRPA